MEKSISLQAIKRMPKYLSYLKLYAEKNESNISAKAVADGLGLGEIQVRKDLAAVSNGGKPKVGYNINELISDIENFLGYNDTTDAVLVGCGKLGRALLSHSGFENYGLNIVAGFDSDQGICCVEENGKKIFPINKLKNLCSRLKIKIGIITVPEKEAQKICDMMIECGIVAIWNFAPTHLNSPDNVVVKNEDLAASLAILSKHLIKS